MADMGRGRPKEEESSVRSIRLPSRIWKLLTNASANEYRSVNGQIQKLVEDFLVDSGMMTDADRKKPISRIENKSTPKKQ
ncbi:hypothetical protein ACFL45_09595 [Candidatus Neomarinimicrobiota bacterium]